MQSIAAARKVALKYMRDPSAPDEVKAHACCLHHIDSRPLTQTVVVRPTMLLQAFVSRWVDSTVKHLHRFTQGSMLRKYHFTSLLLGLVLRRAAAGEPESDGLSAVDPKLLGFAGAGEQPQS